MDKCTKEEYYKSTEEYRMYSGVYSEEYNGECTVQFDKIKVNLWVNN